MTTQSVTAQPQSAATQFESDALQQFEASIAEDVMNWLMNLSEENFLDTVDRIERSVFLDYSLREWRLHQLIDTFFRVARNKPRTCCLLAECLRQATAHYPIHPIVPREFFPRIADRTNGDFFFMRWLLEKKLTNDGEIFTDFITPYAGDEDSCTDPRVLSSKIWMLFWCAPEIDRHVFQSPTRSYLVSIARVLKERLLPPSMGVIADIISSIHSEGGWQAYRTFLLHADENCSDKPDLFHAILCNADVGDCAATQFNLCPLNPYSILPKNPTGLQLMVAFGSSKIREQDLRGTERGGLSLTFVPPELMALIDPTPMQGIDEGGFLQRRRFNELRFLAVLRAACKSLVKYSLTAPRYGANGASEKCLLELSVSFDALSVSSLIATVSDDLEKRLALLNAIRHGNNIIAIWLLKSLSEPAPPIPGLPMAADSGLPMAAEELHPRDLKRLRKECFEVAIQSDNIDFLLTAIASGDFELPQRRHALEIAIKASALSSFLYFYSKEEEDRWRRSIYLEEEPETLLSLAIENDAHGIVSRLLHDFPHHVVEDEEEEQQEGHSIPAPSTPPFQIEIRDVAAAASKGDLRLVERLSEIGTRKNNSFLYTEDSRRRLPIHYAACAPTHACFLSLATRFPNQLDVPDLDGNTPIHLLLIHNVNDGLCQWENQLISILYREEMIGSHNRHNHENQTIMDLARRCEADELVKVLIPAKKIKEMLEESTE
jgi:hypothetical protein